MKDGFWTVSSEDDCYLFEYHEEGEVMKVVHVLKGGPSQDIMDALFSEEDNESTD